MRSVSRVLTIALIALLVGWRVAAQEAAGPLATTLTGFVVTTDAEGKEVLSPSTQAQPGQTLLYRLECKNQGAQPLRDVELVGPVPAATVYLADSASNEPVPQYSIDQGQKYQPAPVKYVVQKPDGTTEERVATPDMYTHLKWRVAELKPGAVVQLQYRVRVK
jgi:uncharacterized repeat protein (TIGR01451 family)